MPREVHHEILMCGHKKCCPVVRVFDDGSAVLIDNDAENGSVGTIKLRPEVAKRLAEILAK
jgi:hypothetical protein